MKLKIEIRLDNAAFEEMPWIEAGRILDELKERIKTPVFEEGYSASLHDINGNKVGYAKVTR